MQTFTTYKFEGPSAVHVIPEHAGQTLRQVFDIKQLSWGMGVVFCPSAT